MLRPTLKLRLGLLVAGFLAFAIAVVGMQARTEQAVSERLEAVSQGAFPALMAIHELRDEFEQLELLGREAASSRDPEVRIAREHVARALRGHLAEARHGFPELQPGLIRLERDLLRGEEIAATRLAPEASAQEIISLADEARVLADRARTDLEALERHAQRAVAGEMEISAEALRELRRTTILVTSLAAAMVVLGTLLNGRRILSPIRALSRAADEVARGRFDHGVPPESLPDDEFRELADAFRRMTRGLQATTVSRDYVDRIVDSMHDLLVVCDPEGRVLTANPAAVELLDWPAEELLGRRFVSLVVDEPHNRAEFHRRWAELRVQGSFEGFELAVRRRDGQPVALMVAGAVLADPRGEIGGYVFTGTDFTERKRAEQELREAKAQAEDAARAKAAFLATMSHEIRTPMTAILGFAETLLERDLSEDDRVDAIQTIQANGRHLVELVNSILDLSKIEAGRLEVERIPVDPWELLEETYRLMRAPAKAKGLKLEMAAMNVIPEKIHTDPVRLRQILINLLGNAIKFSSEGTILLVVHFYEMPETESGIEGPQLELVVVDSGIGMTPEQVARVFEPFTQADGSMTRRFGGTGLGLTISKQLAVLLGGDIVVASQPGQGTAFRVSVATGPVPGVPRVGIEEGRRRWRERTRKSTEDLQTISLARRRVLVVEDNPVNRRLVERMLQRAGAIVEVAGDGPEGLASVRRATAAGNAPEVVVTDLHLPGMDGARLARTLRQEGFAGGVVALSAGAIPEEMRDAFDECLGKPIDRVRLLTTIGRLGRPEPVEPAPVAAAPSEREPAGGLRVLIVEDTPVNQRLVQHILERAGAETALADNGEQAVDAVQSAEQEGRPFDVVLMDIQMPVLDGIEATRQLREGGSSVPIVAVTANATLADREKCLEAGCDDFLPKPIDRRKLLRMVVGLAHRGPAAPARS